MSGIVRRECNGRTHTGVSAVASDVAALPFVVGASVLAFAVGHECDGLKRVTVVAHPCIYLYLAQGMVRVGVCPARFYPSVSIFAWYCIL